MTISDTTATDMTVARTILEQLGGRHFIAMTGSKNFLGGKDTLTFKLGSGALSGITHVRITLTPLDTYTMEFLRCHKFSVALVETMTDVYCDTLQEVFSRVTGLYTEL